MGGSEVINSTYNIPIRSVLYCTKPIEIGSPEVESLTSYINRLAWAYGIGPRLFIAEAILPNLNDTNSIRLFPHRLSTFCREDGVSINAAGENAIEWSNTLRRMTGRLDLDSLTCLWAASLPTRGLLRKSPAWCPDCYASWRESKLPIYQPLYWMFQVVKICTRHNRWLNELCPSCQKPQSAIAATTRLGYCTQCAEWLGISPDEEEEYGVSEDIVSWQQWVVEIINELRQSDAFSDLFRWERYSAKLAICAQVVGGIRQLARITGLPSAVPHHWIAGESIPSFKCLLELCYVLNVSPLQLLQSEDEHLVELLQIEKIRPHPFSNRLAYNQVNNERTLKLINEILDDTLSPPLAVRQIERLLGLGEATLVKHFPNECALLTTKYQAYRAERARQRVERDCEEVRQATITLYKQGINPSKYHLAERLSDPDLMRRLECREIWHTTRVELGIEYLE